MLTYYDILCFLCVIILDNMPLRLLFYLIYILSNTYILRINHAAEIPNIEQDINSSILCTKVFHSMLPLIFVLLPDKVYEHWIKYWE